MYSDASAIWCAVSVASSATQEERGFDSLTNLPRILPQYCILRFAMLNKPTYLSFTAPEPKAQKQRPATSDLAGGKAEAFDGDSGKPFVLTSEQ
jgi:hypothetical protein